MRFHTHKQVLLIVLLFSLCTKLPAQPKIKVACIGNSVTYGSGIPERDINSYPAQLQKMLGKAYQVRNFGIRGTTLLTKGYRPYIQSEGFREMQTFRPDIAIVHLGLNDTDAGNWPNYGDQFMADYSALIDSIRKVNAKAEIYVCLITPIFNEHPRFESSTRDWFWKIQEQIPAIASANHVKLIDFHAPLYARPDLFPDALHPNLEGASILARTVYSHITGNFGGLQLPAVFTSHMVLQRDWPVTFYGIANRNDKVSVVFNGKKKNAVPDENGE